MKAAIRRRYCTPEQIKIETLKQPVPKQDEVYIRVYATTVNRTDCANLTAKPFIMRFVLGLFKPRKIGLGTDFAGEVIAIGENVSSFSVGDRVFGFNDRGTESQAEEMTIHEKELHKIPDKIDYKVAAASLEGAHYAYSFVKKVDIKEGQRVFINGATGGIGSALLQFVRQYNVHISVTCDTKNVELIKSLGADKIYDYMKEDFTSTEDKFDFIFDAVGKSTYRKCKPLLRDDGIYISSELGPYSQNILYALMGIFSRGKKVIFPIPYKQVETIPYIIDHLEKRHFLPVIERKYSLDDISEAYEYVISGKKTGNVVIECHS